MPWLRDAEILYNFPSRAHYDVDVGYLRLLVIDNEGMVNMTFHIPWENMGNRQMFFDWCFNVSMDDDPFFEFTNTGATVLETIELLRNHNPLVEDRMEWLYHEHMRPDTRGFTLLYEGLSIHDWALAHLEDLLRILDTQRANQLLSERAGLYVLDSL
jgi:hypothetical protein